MVDLYKIRIETIFNILYSELNKRKWLKFRFTISW